MKIRSRLHITVFIGGDDVKESHMRIPQVPK